MKKIHVMYRIVGMHIRYDDFEHTNNVTQAFTTKRLDKVRKVLSDSLDWKKAQLVIKYSTLSPSYKGMCPNMEAFKV